MSDKVAAPLFGSKTFALLHPSFYFCFKDLSNYSVIVLRGFPQSVNQGSKGLSLGHHLFSSFRRNYFSAVQKTCVYGTRVNFKLTAVQLEK